VYLLGGARGAVRESPILRAVRRGVDGVLLRSSRLGSPAFAAAVGAVGLAVVVGLVARAPSDGSWVPQFRERSILIDLDAIPGTSDEAMRRIITRLSEDVRAIPGVRTVSAHLGRAIMSDRVTDVNSGEVWVSVDRAADYDATVAAVHDAVTEYPGFDIDVDTYLNERIGDVIEDDEELVVRVYGEKMEKLRGKEEEVEYPEIHPSLHVELDLANARNFGLKPGDVRRAATTLLSGIEVGSLFEEQKVFDVVVWGTPEIRENLNDVGNLLIDTPMRGHVRLKQVAELEIKPAPSVIQRDAVARYIDVSAGVAGRSLASVSAEIQDRARREIEFPLEYRVEVLGHPAARQAGERRVVAFAVAGAIAILLLMQAAFGSWRLALGFFFTLPLALLGGVLAAAGAGGIASLGSVLGLVAVYTIAARNGFSLIQHCRRLEGAGGGAPSVDLVLRGTRERTPPILMVALVAAAAFVPFALLGNVAGNEILRPMAIAILGGLVSSTLVSLLIVPSLYLALGGEAEDLELDLEREAA
jgi:Cu/Ag efflux pump CusA